MIKAIRWTFLFFIGFSGVTASSADILSGLAVQSARKDSPPDPHLYPNETNPIRALEILQSQNSDGYLLSIGSERVFVTAAMAGFEGIIFTDYSPSILYFNQINTGLIAIARNMEDYRHLRLAASQEEWKSAISIFKLQNQDPRFDEILEQLATPDAFNWWSQNIRTAGFAILETRWKARMQPLHAGDGHIYRNVNYLYNPVLFERLHRIIRAKNFEFARVDYNDPAQVKALSDSIRQRGIHLAMVDMSNLWWPIFLSNLGRVNQFLGALAQLPVEPNTILMLTHDALRRVSNIQEISPTQFVYFGFPFERILDPSKRALVAADLEEIYKIAGKTTHSPNLLNGQVFGEDSPCAGRLRDLINR